MSDRQPFGEAAGPGESGRETAVFVLRFTVSAAALALVLSRIDIGAAARVIGDVGALPMIAAFAAYVASQWISANRWDRVLESVGLDLDGGLAVKYYFIGMFFSLFAPSTIGGDLARVFYVRREGLDTTSATLSVVFDRVIGFVWLAAIAAVGLVISDTVDLPVQLERASCLAAGSMLTVGGVAVLLARRRPSAYEGSGKILSGSWALLRDRAMLFRASALSLLVHGAQIVAAVALVTAIVPEVHWSYCVVFHPLVAILAAVPISIAGLGVREAGYVYFLATLGGASLENATAFALVWLAIVLAASALGAVVFFVAGEARPRRVSD
jgi:glycosyltransferase 2 family protein